MKRCLELGRLPKVRKPISFVNFRNTTPGSLAYVFGSSQTTARLLDPTHPVAAHPKKRLRKILPSYQSPSFNMNVYPKALLEKPANPFPNPPFGAVSPHNANSLTVVQESHILDMSLLCIAGVKTVHKMRTVRKKITNKLKAAINLIVSHGASAEQVGERVRLVAADDAKPQNEWILKDWTYVFVLTLDIYRMPYPELVSQLRDALQSVYDAGLHLESTWHPNSKEQYHSPSPSDRQRNRLTSTHENEETYATANIVDAGHPRTLHKPPAKMTHSMTTQYSVNDDETIKEALWETSQTGSQPWETGGGGKPAVQPSTQSLYSVAEEEPSNALSPKVVRRLKASLSWMDLHKMSKQELMKDLGEEERVPERVSTKSNMDKNSDFSSLSHPQVATEDIDTEARHQSKLFRTDLILRLPPPTSSKVGSRKQ